VKRAPTGMNVFPGSTRLPGEDPGNQRVSPPLALQVPGAKYAPGKVWS
jgi:hypothetical protein